MDRRHFLGLSAGAAVAFAATKAAAATTTTVLYGDRTITLDKIRPNVSGPELWVRAADLPRINDFTVKPQGACRDDVCIPIPKELKNGEWFNLTGFAHRTGEAFVSDTNVWSFGEIPAMGGRYLSSRMAPDFAVPNRQGKVVHLSDFRGKKALVITWASW
jgi:hypothetical protein